MSRYFILIILNTPLIVAAILNATVAYKLKRTNKRRFIFRVLFWLSIFAGLIFAQPIYVFLFSNNLTQTEPLSLFDVIQITGIIFSLFIVNQAYAKVDRLEQRFQNLHQELSIMLSRIKSK